MPKAAVGVFAEKSSQGEVWQNIDGWAFGQEGKAQGGLPNYASICLSDNTMQLVINGKAFYSDNGGLSYISSETGTAITTIK